MKTWVRIPHRPPNSLIMKELRKKLKDRVVVLDSGCWQWQLALRNTYGVMKYSGKNESAHRLSYLAFRGKIPDGLLVCHTCDNPACINPKHLFLGTHSDNMQDCSKKGRLVVPLGHPFPEGYQPPNSSVSLPKAKRVKASIKKHYPTLSLKEIAIKNNVSYQMVRDIRRNRSYKSV